MTDNLTLAVCSLPRPRRGVPACRCGREAVGVVFTAFGGAHWPHPHGYAWSTCRVHVSYFAPNFRRPFSVAKAPAMVTS